MRGFLIKTKWSNGYYCSKCGKLLPNDRYNLEKHSAICWKRPLHEADILKEYSENASNSKKAYQAQLEEAALRGNEDAKKKLSDFKNASKGSYQDPTERPDYVETEEGKGTYEPPASKSSKRQNENNVSDVIREAGSNEYSTVEDAPTGEADDYISGLNSREVPTSR